MNGLGQTGISKSKRNQIRQISHKSPDLLENALPEREVSTVIEMALNLTLDQTIRWRKMHVQ